MRHLGRMALRRWRPPHGTISLGRASSSSTSSPSAPANSTMQLDAYAVHSKNQYAAHLLTRDMLAASMERFARRCQLEDVGVISDGLPPRRRRMADFGSADGSSSMATLKHAVHCLRDESRLWGGCAVPLHVTFEEHPASDEEALRTTLQGHADWFDQNDIARDVLMKSFYEPLFEAESMDFIMSYICLHWLDSAAVSEGGNVSEWKRLGADDGDGGSHCNLEWTHINESAAPEHVREAWRTNLAHPHLAKFLALRSREMRPGAEMLLVMVGHPHEFVTPGPLSRAMRRCIDRGEVREEVLRSTVVPYFLRTVRDVEAALGVARTVDIGPLVSAGGEDRPGALLELVDCKSIPAITKGDGDDVVGGAFDLYWSIHVHSIECANPTEEELQCIKVETRQVFGEIYDSGVGIPSTFVACTLRRRTRERRGLR